MIDKCDECDVEEANCWINSRQVCKGCYFKIKEKQDVKNRTEARLERGKRKDEF